MLRSGTVIETAKKPSCYGIYHYRTDSEDLALVRQRFPSRAARVLAVRPNTLTPIVPLPTDTTPRSVAVRVGL